MRKIMIAMTFIITILFTPFFMPSASAFTDVSKNLPNGTPYWAYDAIQEVSDVGYITGYQDGKFYPATSITRSDAAKALAIALQVTPSENFTPKFKDVSKADANYYYIAALAEQGIFNNVEKFNPKNPLKRSQMSKILVEGFKLKMNPKSTMTIQDVPKSDHYYPYVAALANTGITTTKSGEKYNPGGNVSRAHMAGFLTRALAFQDDVAKGVIVYDEVTGEYKKGQNQNAGTVEPLTDSEKTVALVNDYRKKNGGKVFKYDAELSYIAQIKAEDMANKGYFDHFSPTFGKVGEMLDQFNYHWMAYGENIGRGYASPEALVEAWIKSPGHRDNIMNSRFDRIGSGSAIGKDGKVYSVHLFSRK